MECFVAIDETFSGKDCAIEKHPSVDESMFDTDSTGKVILPKGHLAERLDPGRIAQFLVTTLFVRHRQIAQGTNRRVADPTGPELLR